MDGHHNEVDIRRMQMQEIIALLSARHKRGDASEVRLVVADRRHFDHVMRAFRLAMGADAIMVRYRSEPTSVRPPSAPPEQAASRDQRRAGGRERMLRWVGAAGLVITLGGFGWAKVVQQDVENTMRREELSLMFDRSKAEGLRNLSAALNTVEPLLLVGAAISGAALVVGLVRGGDQGR